MKSFAGLSAPFGSSWRRPVLLCQLALTAAALGWVPGNPAKLGTMVVIWRLGFGPIAAAEYLMMAAVNLLFVVMNTGALNGGIFRFDHPDVLGMPVYEYLMWGFYTLHTIRFLDGPAPRGSLILASAAAAAFALPFATITEPALLLAASATVLAGCFALFREPLDFGYAGYMAAIGALIEYIGVGTGQWHYPGQPYGGVPLWFLPMWAGVGLFTRRLIVPLLQRGRAGRAGG